MVIYPYISFHILVVVAIVTIETIYTRAGKCTLFLVLHSDDHAGQKRYAETNACAP